MAHNYRISYKVAKSFLDEKGDGVTSDVSLGMSSHLKVILGADERSIVIQGFDCHDRPSEEVVLLPGHVCNFQAGRLYPEDPKLTKLMHVFKCRVVVESDSYMEELSSYADLDLLNCTHNSFGRCVKVTGDEYSRSVKYPTTVVLETSYKDNGFHTYNTRTLHIAESLFNNDKKLREMVKELKGSFTSTDPNPCGGFR